jgi:hypothetical protein
MKAPVQTNYFVDLKCEEDDGCLGGKGQNTTAGLMKWIADVTIKRRQIRRKYRCTNLLAEAMLTHSLREAKRELALKQEEKRKKLQNFNYQLTMTCTPLNKSEGVEQEGGKASAEDAALQTCLSSLDSFFNELNSVKSC